MGIGQGDNLADRITDRIADRAAGGTFDRVEGGTLDRIAGRIAGRMVNCGAPPPAARGTACGTMDE